MLRYSILIIFTFISTISAHSFLGWSPMPSSAIDISAKGNEVWMINSAKQSYRWVNNDHWVQMPGSAVRVGASPDGWTWMLNATQGVYRWNVDRKAWEKMAGGLLAQISAASRDRAMAVNPAQQIWLWENNAWRQLPGGASWAAICDNDDRWVVNSADQIFRWHHPSNNWQRIPGALVNIDCQSPGRIIGTNRGGAMHLYENGDWVQLPGSGKRATIAYNRAFSVDSAGQIYNGKFGPSTNLGWTQIPGAAREISAKGNELWIINRAQQIYRWVDNKRWVQLPGSAVYVGASPDGWTWVVTSSYGINRWNVDKGNWDQMPGGLAQISAASKDRAMGVNSAQQIWLWENNAWRQLPGAATWAAICDQDERWVVNSADQVFRWNHQITNWQWISGSLINIDCQNPGRVIGTNRTGQMFLYENGYWKHLAGSGTRATISNNRAFCVNSADEIWIENAAVVSKHESEPDPAPATGTDEVQHHHNHHHGNDRQKSEEWVIQKVERRTDETEGEDADGTRWSKKVVVIEENREIQN